MLLTITTTYQPATDLGYLLHKHPDRLQDVKLSIGKAHIFYPESSPTKTTAALLLEVNPIDMVRGGRNLSGKGFSLGQYVNDRPYVASSFMSVAIAKAFASAMNGNCKDRPELVDKALPFEVTLAVLPAPKGGELLIRRCFEPLGYEVEVERHTLDPKFPAWGDSKFYTLHLKHCLPLQQLLSHLYVLIPALDHDKHYFVDQQEIDKLLEKGRGWLEQHPEREQITRRYLLNFKGLARAALERLSEGEPSDHAEETTSITAKAKRGSLHDQRLKIVLEQLKASRAKRVIDLGCGEGKLMRLLLKERQFEQITGMDVSYSELTKCKDRLYWDELAPKQKERLKLFQGALTYRDKRLEGYDAAAIVEVIEHLDENRLVAFERVVFEAARPKTVVLTTPNGEYNVRYEQLSAGDKRHDDHRFEWSRAEFLAWANHVAEQYAYTVTIYPIGDEDPEVGAPSQMAVFTYET